MAQILLLRQLLLLLLSVARLLLESLNGHGGGAGLELRLAVLEEGARALRRVLRVVNVWARLLV